MLFCAENIQNTSRISLLRHTLLKTYPIDLQTQLRHFELYAHLFKVARLFYKTRDIYHKGGTPIHYRPGIIPESLIAHNKLQCNDLNQVCASEFVSVGVCLWVDGVEKVKSSGEL